MSEGFTTRQKEYEQILFHRAKVQISGHYGSSHASYLIGSTVIETLFSCFQSETISLPKCHFFKFTVSIRWQKFGNKRKLETAIARYKFLFQAYMPHSFGVISPDESDRRL